jgi:hypothetical protein
VATRRPDELHLSEQRAEDDFHFVQRESHTKANTIAAAKRKPFVAAEFSLQETFRTECVRLRV